jgi:hypothetical protein
MKIFTTLFLFALAANGQTFPAVVKQQGFVPFSDAPIHYRAEVLDDPVARLEKQLEKGDVRLEYAPEPAI